jgi:hypothetical protein
MSGIVNRAKPYARKLVLGEAFSLDESGQEAIAGWVALSALMVNQITKSLHKLPAADIDYFFHNHRPPNHWFVGIGYYVGPAVLASNHAPFRYGLKDVDGNQSTVFIKHVFASIIGSLFTIVDVCVESNTPIGPPPNGPAYVPYIIGIQPSRFSGIPFPPPAKCIIWGPEQFVPGSNALAVARMAIDPLRARIDALYARSI